MTLENQTSRIVYWNYFLSIESDLRKLSRFVEFCRDNENVYSTEIARLLLTASSEFEVISKELLKLYEPNKCGEIQDYKIPKIREELLKNYQNLPSLEVMVRQYNLLYKPFADWSLEEQKLSWWSDYNNVKHNRAESYKKANLKNLVQAVMGLYVVELYYFNKLDCIEQNKQVEMSETTLRLKPYPQLLKVNADYGVFYEDVPLNEYYSA